MAQWGRNDTAVTANSVTTKESSNGAPIGTYALVKGDQVNRVDGANAHFGNTSLGSRAYTDFNMFGNVTIGAFMPNKAVGVFAVNAAMMQTTGGNLVIGIVTSGGSGYGANATVTLTVTNGGTSAVVNAQVGSTNSNTGRVIALNIQTPGSGYITSPSVAIAAPAAINITANSTGFSNTTDTLVVASANSKWQVGDRLYYAVPAANTPIAPLTGNTYYYVSFANTTRIAISATAGGANIDITDARVTATGEVHTIQGDTATGYVDVNTDNPLVAHTGWDLRTEGTGGRAGRIQYETLVAMGSIGANTTSATGRTGNPDTVTSNTVDQYV